MAVAAVAREVTAATDTAVAEAEEVAEAREVTVATDTAVTAAETPAELNLTNRWL